MIMHVETFKSDVNIFTMDLTSQWPIIFSINVSSLILNISPIEIKRKMSKLSIKLKYCWVSDCCLMPSENFFNSIMAGTSYFLMRWWWCLLCTRPTCLVGFLWCQLTETQSIQLHTLSWFWTNQSLLLILNALCLAVTKYQCYLY